MKQECISERGYVISGHLNKNGIIKHNIEYNGRVVYTSDSNDLDSIDEMFDIVKKLERNKKINQVLK